MRASPRARGFTLLETMLAITLTAVVLGIAGAALRTAADARGTVLAHRERQQADARFRATLTDMLHHAPPASAVDEPLLRIGDGAASIVFLSRGVLQPFGVGRIWRVTLTSDAGGTSLEAAPLAADANDTPVRWHVAGVRIAAIDVLERASAVGDAQRWRSDWPIAGSRPALLRIRFDRTNPSNAVGASATPSRGVVDATPVTPFVVDLAPLEHAS